MTICAVLGWDLRRVLGLTWPQFQYVSLQLHRLQYLRAKNEVFFGVCAALGGENNRQNLLDNAGNFFVEEPEPELQYTSEELAVAEKRMDRITAERRSAEQEERA